MESEGEGRVMITPGYLACVVGWMVMLIPEVGNAGKDRAGGVSTSSIRLDEEKVVKGYRTKLQVE